MNDQKSKKIFLVLGIAREKRNWNTPIEILQKELPEYEIIALDNPGVGEHHKMNVPLSVKAHVDFLKKRFDKLKGEENYFIGWSLGGMIVSKWSQLYPQDMKGMVLVTSSYGSSSPFWHRLRPLIVGPMVMTIFSKGKKREKGLFETTCLNEKNKERLINEWEKINDESPVTGINIIRQVVAAFFFFTRLKKTPPTLVLGAPKDELVNNKCSKKIASVLNAPYEEHPTAGHDILNDDPEWVSTKVKNWLNSSK